MAWPRHDGLEVVVQKADGTPYPLVVYNGKFIVIAEAGDTFEVAVKRGRTHSFFGHTAKMLVSGTMLQGPFGSVPNACRPLMSCPFSGRTEDRPEGRWLQADSWGE